MSECADIRAYINKRWADYRQMMFDACERGDFEEAARLRAGMQAISAIGGELLCGFHEGYAAPVDEQPKAEDPLAGLSGEAMPARSGAEGEGGAHA